jgi:alkaline phosphatase
LEEAIQFDNAIAAALNLTNPADTLIIVTADHAHTMSINGYPVRGNNLLGIFGVKQIKSYSN